MHMIAHVFALSEKQTQANIIGQRHTHIQLASTSHCAGPNPSCFTHTHTHTQTAERKEREEESECNEFQYYTADPFLPDI